MLKKLNLNEIFLLLIVEIIVFIKFFINRNYFFDDTLIYARYIKNFNNGLGLVYNKDELFNGLTSPLYTYLNLLITSITKFDNQIFLNNFIGYIFISLSVVLFYSVLKKLKYSFIVIVSILILYGLSNIYLFLGMETGLYLFLIIALFYLYYNEKYLLYFLTSGLLIITRTEGVFFIFTTIVLFLVERKSFKKVFFLYALIPIIILLVHFSFNTIYYGSIFPDSSKAKIFHGLSKYWGDQNTFINGILQFLTYDYKSRGYLKYLYYIILLLIPIAFIFKKKNIFDYYLLISNVLLILFYLYFNVPLYLWYIAPLIFTKIYFVVIGVEFCVNKFIRIEKNKTQLIFSSLIIFLLAFTFNYNRSHVNSSGPTNEQREQQYIKISKWIVKNTSPNASIGAAEIGIIGYYTDRKIIDFCGLISKDNARFLSERKPDACIERHKPSYVLLNSPEWAFEPQMAKRHKNYIKVKSFNFKGFEMYKRVSH